MNQQQSLLMKMRRPLAAVALGGMIALSLQGCFAVFAGGALATTFAATDRRTLGAQTEDKGIVLKGENRIPEVVANGSHVNVTAFNRKVLLTGEVVDEASKAAAVRETKAISNVDTVYDELIIAPASSFSSRSSDALITSKVLASLVDDKTLYSSAFKVTTERGIVYMMGRVTTREGQLAAKIASGVSSVQKVVTLYEYITEDELAEYQRKPASENKPAN